MFWSYFAYCGLPIPRMKTAIISAFAESVINNEKFNWNYEKSRAVISYQRRIFH